MIEQTTKSFKSGSETRKRQGNVKMRVDDAEKAEILHRAASAGLCVSGFLRKLIFGEEKQQPRAARRPTVEVALLGKLRFELRKIGGHLQQIATHLNQGKDFDDHAFTVIYGELRVTLKVILKAVRKKTPKLEPPSSQRGLVDKLFDLDKVS